jgi:hypothetical protein
MSDREGRSFPSRNTQRYLKKQANGNVPEATRAALDEACAALNDQWSLRYVRGVGRSPFARKITPAQWPLFGDGNEAQRKI